MSLKIDKVQLEIIMKADSARSEMRKLDDEAKAITKSMKGLKKDSQEYIDKNNELTKVKARWTELNSSISLTNKTMRELQQQSKSLSLQMRNMDPNTAKYKEMQQELKLVNNRMKELRGTAQSTQSGLSGLATGFNKYFALWTAFIASITGASLAFRKLAEDVAHMDDVYSDVMKTTGMTHEQVVALNDELKKMDTRTSRESLNNLARDAGKLGISGTKNIMDFVDAGNQINVALGEDLGDDAIKNIGKMVGVFENSTQQLKGIGLKEQMLAVGSAVNELGASSTASEPYLVSFAGRLGGISKQAKLSMADILGFGSALDQDMQQVEMSSTALQKFIMKLMGEPAKFARLAGLEVKGFTDLLNTDANAAIKQVLRALNEQGGFQALIPIFQEMGLDGARAAGVISAMAGSIDKIDEAQRVANESMSEGVSITKEYDIKNNNLAARLDKAKKAFQETALELGERLNPVLLKSVKGTTYLIRAMVELPKWLKENAGLLSTLAIVMTAYGIAANWSRLMAYKWLITEELKAIRTKASTAATLLQTAVTNYLTGSTIAANVATKAFFATLGLNPFVAIGVALAAVTIGLYKLATRTKEMALEQKLLTETNDAVNNELERETINLEAYKKRLQETEPNSKERIKLVQKLKEEYPGLLDNIDAESASVGVLNSTLGDYMKTMSDNIRLKVLYSKITDKISSLEGEKDYTKRTQMQEELEILKKQYEFQQLVIEYGEENAKLVSQKADLEKKANALNIAVQIESFDTFEKMWKSENERKKIIYNSVQAEQDALNKAYNEQTKIHEQTKAEFLKTRENLKKISSIINPTTKNVIKEKNKTTITESLDDKGKKDDPFTLALKAKENAYKQSQLELMEQRRLGEISEKTYNEIALQTQLLFLEEKKKLQEKFKQDTIDTEIEISNQKSKIGQDADKAALLAIANNQEAGLTALESGENTKLEMLQETLGRGLITEKEYNLEVKKLAVELNAAKLALAQASLTALEKVSFNDKEIQKKALEDAKAEIEKLQASLLKAQGDVAKDVAKGVEKNARSVSDIMRDVFGNSFADIGVMFENFTTSLDKLKNDELGSWTDWGTAIGGIIQASLAVATQVNDEYFQYKAASLEADKQRELSNAGDSSEERQRINEEYAQKELDLKKKQSSSDTTLKVAQAIAAGGLAIVQAFAQLGPIGGAIAALFVGGVTGLQVGTILKQNAAIQATTLDSSASSSTGSQLGQGARVVTAPQAAEGRYDVIGAQDAKMYKNVRYAGNARTGMVRTPTLYGEAGTEMVVSAPHLNKLNMKAPHFLPWFNRNIVNQRADGNYAPIANSNQATPTTDNSQLIAANIVVMQKNADLLQYLIDNGLEAFIMLDQFEKKVALRDKSLKKGSLN